jgi:hypothetical protein
MRLGKLCLAAIAVAIIGFLTQAATPVSAQQEAAEWSGTYKITAGTCPDGAMAVVAEQTGIINYKIMINGRTTLEFKVILAADGSGRSEYQGSNGKIVLDIPPGHGKRTFTTSQVNGACRWIVAPASCSDQNQRCEAFCQAQNTASCQGDCVARQATCLRTGIYKWLNSPSVSGLEKK